ncbi:MAG: beta-galactosidase [Lachnospiraceae bacterium]|nr:beta-galactosidase [Lachnospiraceae bacterium]
MIGNSEIKKILYGGDYNPEQWPEEIWEEDMRMLKLAHIDILTLNVFNWAMLQPDENTYDFSKMDKIMNMVRDNGFKVFMATSTGAHPAWMARKHPDILRTQANGVRRKYGRRHNACPNSPTYRKYAATLTERIAQRYAGYENIVAWHVSNEYGGICYCDNCERKFREWVKEKYKTIDAVNHAWNMNFWSHTLYDWDDIVVPSLITEEFEAEGLRTTFQGISLDYARFNSDSMLECYKMEKEILKKITPHIPVSTNFMGMYKPLDYQKWSRELDFAGWDNYPEYHDEPAEIAMRHDLMRGLKQGQPFALLEQTPSVNNWHAICKLKRPDVMRLWSYQAVAHGADTIMFFQMRRSLGACEKFHGAVIDHVGHENTRVFREIEALGSELKDKIKDLTVGSRMDSKIAILFDWDNWWASEFSAGPSRAINYPQEVKQYYKALYNLHHSVDMVSVEDDLSGYRLVIAPLLYMCKDGFDEKIREYVKNGGAFLTTYFSGYVDEHDLVVPGGYPGKLRDILGIWVEEIDALPEEESNSFDYKGKKHPAYLACDIMHLEGAKEICRYDADFYHGMPVVTKNQYGRGLAYYVGTRTDEAFYREFLGDICEELSIEPVIHAPEGIEAAMRKNEKGEYLFLLNHTKETLSVRMEKAGTDILTDEKYGEGDLLTIKEAGAAIVRIGKEKEA